MRKTEEIIIKKKTIETDYTQIINLLTEDNLPPDWILHILIIFLFIWFSKTTTTHDWPSFINSFKFTEQTKPSCYNGIMICFQAVITDVKGKIDLHKENIEMCALNE